MKTYIFILYLHSFSKVNEGQMKGQMKNAIDKINPYDIIMISKRKKEFDTYGRKSFSW